MNELAEKSKCIGTIGVIGGPEYFGVGLGDVLNHFKEFLSAFCPRSIGTDQLQLIYNFHISGSVWDEKRGTRLGRRHITDGRLLFVSFSISKEDGEQGAVHFAKTFCRMIIAATHHIFEYSDKKGIIIDKALVLTTVKLACHLTLQKEGATDE